MQQKLGDREVGREPEPGAHQRPVEQGAGGAAVSVDEWVVVADHEVEQDRPHDRVSGVCGVRREVAEPLNALRQFVGGRRTVDDIAAARDDEHPRFARLLEAALIGLARQSSAVDDAVQLEDVFAIDRLAARRPVRHGLHGGEVVGDHSLAVIGRRAPVAQHFAGDLAAGVRAFELAGADRFVHERQVETAAAGAAGDQSFVGQRVPALLLIKLP